MTVTPAVFKMRFPEFATEDDERIQLYLDDAQLQMNESFWGIKYELGTYYFAAHLLWLSDKGTSSSGKAIAPIASQTVDGVNVTYVRVGGGGDNRSGLTQNDVFTTSSVYGQRYLNLKKSLGTVAFAI